MTVDFINMRFNTNIYHLHIKSVTIREIIPLFRTISRPSLSILDISVRNTSGSLEFSSAWAELGTMLKDTAFAKLNQINISFSVVSFAVAWNAYTFQELTQELEQCFSDLMKARDHLNVTLVFEDKLSTGRRMEACLSQSNSY